LPPFNDRFPGKLESILGSISQTYGGDYLYPSVLDAAAGYLFRLICEHPFYNGNKRVAILFTDIFLYINGLELLFPYQDLYILSTMIAKASEEKKYKESKLRALCKQILIDYTREITEV